MTQEIIPLKLSIVNSYLIKNEDNYFLIDTGFALQRRTVEKEMVKAGCRPGNLKLIIITHGDSDHTGNAACIREKYGARIAMHPGEVATVEKGDMRLNRDFRKNRNNPITGMILKMPVARLSKANRFKPDIYLEDGRDMSEYGLDARVIHIPGHSMGSMGVLTGEGDIFCGDLLLGGKKPKKNSLVDSAADMEASIERLRELEVKMVYPGHGKPFKMADLV